MKGTISVVQRVIEEAAVRRVARERGGRAVIVSLALSMPLGASIMALTVPRAVLFGGVLGPLVGFLPAIVIGAFVQERFLSRWKRNMREARTR
jgi:hypothetical protein